MHDRALDEMGWVMDESKLRRVGPAAIGRALSRLLVLALCGSMVSFGAPRMAVAHGIEPSSVPHGDVVFQQFPDQHLVVIHQGTPEAIVQYLRFDLPAGHRVVFDQPSEFARIMNQIMSSMPSQINGEVLANGIVYFMTGFQKYAINAVKLSSKGDVTGGEEVVWSSTDSAPYVASPLLYDGLLYVTKFNRAIVSCIDAKTGKVHYGPERLKGIRTIYASVSGAKGKIYITGRRGTTIVLKHGKKFEILATNELDDRIDASPVIVGKQIFMRGDKYVYCIEKNRTDY